MKRPEKTTAATYGCWNRPPYADSYTSTGSDKPIPHVLSQACQYTHTDLGQRDPKCLGCVWRKAKLQ